MNKDENNETMPTKDRVENDTSKEEGDVDHQSQLASIPTPPAMPNPDTVKGFDRRNYLVAVLLAAFLPFGVTRMYTGFKSGKIRVFTFLTALMVSVFFVPISVAIGAASGASIESVGLSSSVSVLVMGVLVIWGWIDFILSLSRKKDADGNDLVATSRDTKWAKVVYWTVLIFFILYIITALFMFMVFLYAFQNATHMGQPLVI